MSEDTKKSQTNNLYLINKSRKNYILQSFKSDSSDRPISLKPNKFINLAQYEITDISQLEDNEEVSIALSKGDFEISNERPSTKATVATTPEEYAKMKNQAKKREIVDKILEGSFGAVTLLEYWREMYRDDPEIDGKNIVQLATEALTKLGRG